MQQFQVCFQDIVFLISSCTTALKVLRTYGMNKVTLHPWHFDPYIFQGFPEFWKGALSSCFVIFFPVSRKANSWFSWYLHLVFSSFMVEGHPKFSYSSRYINIYNKQPCCAGCRRRPFLVQLLQQANSTYFSKIAVTTMQLRCPSGFRMS